MTVFTWPNLLSTLRLLSVPFFALAVLRGEVEWAFGIFVVSGVTDAFDGWIARRFGQTSTLGTYLDPAADKILVLTAYVVLSLPDNDPLPRIPVWITFLVFLRDVSIVTGALILRGRRRLASFRPLLISKGNTVVQLVAITVVLGAGLWSALDPIVVPLLWLTAASTVASGIEYAHQFLWRRLPPVVVIVALVSLVGLVPSVEAKDLRSTERLSYVCRSELGQRDITLFANGTVRLREGLHGERRMGLAELDPEELATVVTRLGESDATGTLDSVPSRSAFDEPWISQCQLRVELADTEPKAWYFSQVDSLSLEVGRLIRIAEELAARTRTAEEPSGLPFRYEPEAGDILVGIDASRWRVVGLTSDGLAVELDGIGTPMRIYVLKHELRKVFVERER
ncbi:MAG: CDP-alcohol phosphatidyltransferase family protein [Acidobacteriota bacterium]